MEEFLFSKGLDEIVYLIRIVFAAVCGLGLGIERMMREKEAGIRTHIILIIGAALITCISISFGGLEGKADSARIAAQIVSGVGFIGAGMIMFRGEALQGLTTAAGIWTTAGIGMAAGSGMYILAFAVTALVVFAQVMFHGKHGHFIGFYRYIRVVFVCDEDTVAILKDQFQVRKFGRLKMTQREDKLVADAVIRTKADCGVEKLTRILRGTSSIMSIERLDITKH